MRTILRRLWRNIKGMFVRPVGQPTPRADEHFFDRAVQYYVAARFSAMAKLIPVSGNQFHHALEMLLKGQLAKTLPLAELKGKKYGHSLPRTWKEFKRLFPSEDLSRFDGLIRGLDRFERIRYPDHVLQHGMASSIGWTTPSRTLALGPGVRAVPRYDCVVQDLDRLIGELFRLCSLNPVHYMGHLNDHAIRVLENDNAAWRGWFPEPESGGTTVTIPLDEGGFLQLFGWISMYFATLDFFVTQAILRLAFRAKLDRANALTDRTTLGGKFRLLEGLRPEQVTDPAVLDEIQKLLPEALKVSEMRNRFTHDNWVFDRRLIATGRIKRVRFVGLDQWETDSLEEEHGIEELVQFFNRIGELQKRFVELSQRLPPIIRFRCPQCGAAVEVVAPATPAAGAEVACSHCGHRQTIIASSGTPGG